MLPRRHRRHPLHQRRGSRLGQRLARSRAFSWLCAHRFLVLEGALAVVAVVGALLLSWPSREPVDFDDQRDAWRRSLAVASYAAAHGRADAEPSATGAVAEPEPSIPVSLSVSAKERIDGPRLMAKLRPVLPETIVPEEGLPPLPAEPMEEHGTPVAVPAEEEAPASSSPAVAESKPVEKPVAVAAAVTAGGEVPGEDEAAGGRPDPRWQERRQPPPGGTPPWLRHAVAAAGPADDRPMIAVIIDDLGLRRRLTAEVVDLPPPLTLAFLPYAGNVDGQARAARRAGHELLVHMPMEPLGKEDPGPQALLTSLPDNEFRRRLLASLASFDGYVGVNNHMGSRATADRRKMALVMEELSARGLLFVDSRTTPLSVAGAEAQRRGVPSTGRDVFLDNEADIDHIRAQLRHTETIARRTGAAVAIGHPYPETVAALAGWLPTLEERGFALVPVTTVVARRLCRDGTLPAACRAYAALQTPVN